MKRYVNCYPADHIGVYRTAEDAKRSAGPTAYAIAVEVPLPDPPHVWKVGGWFRFGLEPSQPRHIVDLTDDMVAYHLRLPSGRPDAYTIDRSSLTEATPCDPPAWFTDDRAS